MSPSNADPLLPGPPAPVVGRALRNFALSSVVALVLLAIGSVFAVDRVARREALRDASVQAEGLAGFVTSMAGPALHRGDPEAARPLDELFQGQLRAGGLRRVKLWSAEGTVLWSDRDELIGRQFVLPDDVRSLLGTDRSVAEVSDVDQAENVAERDEGQLLEVYVGAKDATGQPTVFEAYLSTDRLNEGRRAMLSGTLPVTLGGLVLFQLAVLPLALALARRVEKAQAERWRSTQHALLASDLERRRIAQDLHDGVIQELSGLAYAMPTMRIEAGEGKGTKSRLTLDHAHKVLLGAVAALRRLVTDSYPPDLDRDGLRNALGDLAAVHDRLSVTLDLDGVERVTGRSARLVYRVVREGLRNVSKHARASSVTVRMRVGGSETVVQVEDDGVGMPTVVPEGHIGLRLLEDTLRDVGGTVSATRGAGGGSLLEARFPTTRG